LRLHTERGRRWIARGAVAGLGLVFVLGAALLGRELRTRASARAAFPQADGRIEVAGLENPIEILRDARGVPHVLARSERDALLGLGYAHAQDRLGQMQWLARSARGRSAEWEGPAALAADRLARTLDFAGLAERQLADLDGDTRRVLGAYARGVNARIARIRAGEAAPPLSLARRGLALEDWRPADSLAVLKLYAWGLSETLGASLVLEDLIEQLGPTAARPFEPDGGQGGLSPRRATAVTAGLGPRRGGPAPDPLRRALGLAGASAGSSAWVVGGAHTQSGRPLLVADSHLEPTVPALLHVAHVRGGALDAAGATLPGVPVFWTGHNQRVAWASTHARVATSDLYRETLQGSRERYHDGRGWAPLREREETILVRGGLDRVETVRSTHHGPLIEGLADDGREPLSLAWAGARPGDRSLAAWLAVARADGAAALVAALASHAAPVLAVVYADADGNAGLQLAGWIPRRSFAARLQPLPGRANVYDWGARIPFQALPAQRLQDGRGWLVAADNRFSSGADEALIEWLWRSGERARRIDQLLRSSVRLGPVDLRRMARVQTDLRMLRAQDLLRDSLALAGDPAELAAEAREVVALLGGWSGEARASSPGAATYHVFLGALTEQLLERQVGEGLLSRYLALPQGDPARLVADIVRAVAEGSEDAAWGDRERVRQAVRDSLRETWFRLSYRLGPNRRKWSWGRLHPLSFRPMGLPSVARGQRELGPFEVGGSSTTVAAADYDPALPFDVRTASTFRFAIDTAALDESLMALAPGVSEHPGHPHFRDGLAPWLEGRPGLLVTSRLAVVESALSRLVLAPPPES